ncbi:carotenoid oxygenase family protein [Streptomyces krungchingensis]
MLGHEDPRAHHWMLGEGMVHGVRLRDGRAERYRNRRIRSSAVARKRTSPASRSPASTCRDGCRPASTGAGLRTREER